jgi:hypothetical protein
MNSNVLAFRHPSHQVKRTMEVDDEDTLIVVEELKELLRKTPYPMGAPNPKGGLIIKLRRVKIEFEITVFRHAGFSNGEPLTLQRELESLESSGVPVYAWSVIRAALNHLRGKHYRLMQVMNEMQPEPHRSRWCWQPTHNTPNYEAIAMSICHRSDD